MYNQESLNSLSTFNLLPLSESEKVEINGGNAGDAAELVGRNLVWTLTHIYTGGASTIYMALKNLF